MKHPEIWESIRTLMKYRNDAPPLKSSQLGKNIPLSFSQERLWLKEQLNPDCSDFNVPYALKLKGNLNVEALEKSLATIQQRHSILRTTFQEVDDKTIQNIGVMTDWKLERVDLKSPSKKDYQSQINDLIKEESQRPFNLSKNIPLRAKLLEIDEQEHILLLTFHHIVFDASSDLILFKELNNLYQSFSKNQPYDLPSLSIEYADFAIWQRQWLEGEFMQNLLNYWKEKLYNLSELKLPLDKEHQNTVTSQQGKVKHLIPQKLVESINILVKTAGITPFIFYLAAFKVLLSVYLNQEDIFVCVPIANRNRSEVQHLIGYFANLLIYRTNLAGNPTVKDFLARVRQTSSGAYAHQDLPIQLLVDQLNLAHISLSQVMFAWDDIVDRPTKLGDLSLNFLEEQRGTEFNWFLSIQREKGELTAVFKYNKRLFEEATIKQMLSDYQTILERIVVNQKQSIAQLLCLSDTQKKELQSKLDFSRTCRQSSSAEKYIAPRNQLELQLTQIWEQVLKISPIGIKDNFFELGGKSLLAIRLINQIEEKLGSKLPFSALVKAPTIEQLADMLGQDEVPIPWTPVVALQPEGTNPPLFLVPPAACTAIHFADLASCLGLEQPVYGLEPLGMDGQQEAHKTVEAMASYYLEQIKTIQPEGPYLLGGRCMGGIVAFEMALQLQAKDEEVKLVAIIDTQNPPSLKKRDFLYYLNQIWLRFRKFKFFFAFLLGFLDKFQRITSTNIEDKHIQNVLDTHKKARRHYIARIYTGKIDLFKNQEESLDNQAKWSELTSGEIHCHLVKGDHKTMLERPYVNVFAQTLRVCINQNLKGV